jgi:hypothetical protein
MSAFLPLRALVFLGALSFLTMAHAADPLQQALLDADAARIKAQIGADEAALRHLLSEDLTYVHTTGALDGKAQLMDKIKSGALVYQQILTRDVVARSYGPAGVVTGLAELHVLNAHQPRTLSTRYTATYVQRDGRWQLVAYQSTQLPAP